jgi:membrane protease YdiL (CAAX protease family)
VIAVSVFDIWGPLIFESADVTFQPLVDTCDETKLPPEGLGSSISRALIPSEVAMTTMVSARVGPTDPKLIAPLWHTGLLLTIFVALALVGVLFQHRAGVDPGMLQQHSNMVPLYLSLLAMEWGLFLYVRKGIRLTGFSLRTLIGGRWTNASRVAVDISLALATWVLWTLVQLLWDHVSGPSHAASIQILLPQGVAENVLWIAVSISAGICEELAFRGYFQRQFAALAHSRWIALFAQAALFGISHGYQGTEACARIAVFGLLFGALAMWRNSLRPGMLAHAWGDIASGIIGI